MALILRQQGLAPLGQYDFLDSQLASIRGGELGRFVEVANDGSDKAAFDATDGYAEAPNVRTQVALSDADDLGPYLLLDDGTSSGDPDTPGYGTQLGSIIGGTAGQTTQVSGATVVGPPTQTGSGKVTCWHMPGLYSTDNHSLTTGQLGNPPAPGTPLYSDADGKLTTTDGGGDVAAYFVEIDNDESLVSTKFGNTAPLLTFLKSGH